MELRAVSLDELTVDDERSFAHVAIYGRLEQALRRSKHKFRIPADAGATLSWDRALFLNLTYWNDADGADVLCDAHIPADVVAHVAWHHVVSREIARRAAAGAEAPPSARAMFLAESIASAFDLYLVGRLLPNAPDSEFIATQVPILSEVAAAAGLSESAFAALLVDVSRAPEQAFEDLRAMLFDAACALLDCRGAVEAQAALDRFDGHRFGSLLHHYQLSNWILYARAYAADPGETAGTDTAVAQVDAELRAAPASLDWLETHWIDADLTAGP